ncbi:hypothetical protein LshimejAT787_0603830 [Lyophyllum shimeji]|uniref:CST complex subunit STN1 n=1 Tax=Lyophyllum shimeji TaxID=47721 RepID=A0A9P3UQH1_LYOSH|nr:hypothetical protein LshimejAT787_0603830 [Lyophyllum shimeji]
MSFTATIEQRTSQTGAIFLSPSKRRKLEPDTEQEQASDEPTTAELWKWTLKHESIASCFIRDVFEMRENVEKDANFFWLGRVPCRTVRIVGLVVGVQVYEKRIRYTVDDGTAVVDCLHRQLLPPKTPSKKSQANTQGTKSQTTPPPEDPKPVARVGRPVCVVGRVVRKYETREIVVDSIVACPSANDEPRHWLEVLQLHKSHYSASASFRIPKASTAALQTSSPVKAPQSPTSATRDPVTPSKVLSTPSTAISTLSTTHTTPSTSSSPASPAKCTTQSPQKLRHPSRLHSRDLNGNTFRIYVKHYMDRMTYADHISEPDYDSLSNEFMSDADCPPTPTKPARRVAPDETPRASTSGLSMRTPRPRIPALSFDGHHRRSTVVLTGKSRMVGFTISYLRRVPELADMAKRVVKAVAKRRLREERQKAKEAAASGTTQSTRHKQGAPTSKEEEADKLAGRVKRLFQATIVQLLREGSIVLWDGPVRRYDQVLKEPDSGLWKANVTSTSADSTVFSTASGVSRSSVEADEDNFELSDPESGEEAYVPLSPQFLAGVVETAIRKLTSVRPRGGENRSLSTKEGILAYLKRDDRWRYLSEWSVGEALEVLRAEGRGWCVGKEKWELSL